MRVLSRVRLILLVAVWCLAAGRAQQMPPSNSSGYPAQSPPIGSSGTQNPPTRASAQQSALENPILDETKEEENLTYLESYLSFEYRHDNFDGGSSGDSIRLRWQQSFGGQATVCGGNRTALCPRKRRRTGRKRHHGIWRYAVGLQGMLWKGEKFENAAGVELTLPSASNDAIGEVQTVLKLLWGFFPQMTPRTLLSGELGYNKTVQNQRGTPEADSIEPDIILRQESARSLAGYLDWDNIYEFSVDQYVSTLEAGMNFALDHRDRWTVSPYVVFPLNHGARTSEAKIGGGFILTRNF